MYSKSSIDRKTITFYYFQYDRIFFKLSLICNIERNKKQIENLVKYLFNTDIKTILLHDRDGRDVSVVSIFPKFLREYKGGAGLNDAILQGVLMPGDVQCSIAGRWCFPFG